MTALTATRHLASVSHGRGFRLIVNPSERDTYGVTLDEVYGYDGDALAHSVVTATATQTGRVLDAILTALRDNHVKPSSLAFDRVTPIALDEATGVRLALVLITTQPIAKHDRVRALVTGVSAMSVEESYYWYAKCLGPESNRARKALRTLLADD